MCDLCQSETESCDERRERVYGFLAALFSHPDAGNWGRVTNAQDQRADIAAVDALRLNALPWEESLGADDVSPAEVDLRGVVVGLCQPLKHLKAEYERFFRRSRLNARSLLELDHRGASQRRRVDDFVADLSRIYEDEGYPAREGWPLRPDHIAHQMSYMAWLIGQARLCRRVACANTRTAEAVRGYDLAQRRFFGDHLAGWVPTLAAQLQKHVGGGYLEQLGRFLAAWVLLERQYMETEPRFAEMLESPATRPAVAKVGRKVRQKAVSA